MATNREKLLTDALRLPTKDRASIAAALLRSLEADEETSSVDEAWTEEIRRRLADLDAGRAETLSPDEARRFITSDAGET